jgi:hypothetical protein
MMIDDIRTFLMEQGVVTPIYLGYIPDDDDVLIVIFDTGGMPADTLGRENERRTFQVRNRASRLDYQKAYDDWKNLFDILQDSTPTPEYAFVQAIHYGPMMFNDDAGRPNMTANFRVMKARET